MCIRVNIDNEEIMFGESEQQPILHGGRTYVPVRALFTHMGYEVTWTPGTGSNPKGTVTIEKGDDEIIIGEEASVYSVNGTTYNHPDNLVPMIVGGRLMIPIRGVLESIGYFVDWDADTETVVVKTNNEEETTIFKPLANTTYKIAAMAGTTTGTEQTIKYLSLHSRVENNAAVYIDDVAMPNLWQIAYANDGVAKIIMCNNSDYALNYYYLYGLGNPGNCDVYPHSNNPDATVEFLNDEDNPYSEVCIIKLVREDTNLYLTADNSTNGSNVSWQPYNGSNNQKWKFIESSVNTSNLRKEIDLPNDRIYNWNQFYDEIVNKINSEAGCTWTCGLDVANIYGPYPYSPNDMPDEAWVSGVGYAWKLPNGCAGELAQNFYADNDLLASIRSEINNNRPVIIKLSNPSIIGYKHHYVVAYGYTGDGTQKSDILVLDPSVRGDYTNEKLGNKCTLIVAETNNSGTTSTGERQPKLMNELLFTSGR